MPKLEYPAYFEGGLIGMRATQTIEHGEAYLSVPHKLLLTFDKAQNHPVLSKVYSENPYLFSLNMRPNSEQLTLVVNLIYEHVLGESSFWKPYLDILPDVTFLCHWPLDILEQAQDNDLVSAT